MHSDRLPTSCHVVRARRLAAVFLAVSACGLPAASLAQATATEGVPPSGQEQVAYARPLSHAIFGQAGVAKDTSMLVVGVAWDWPWHRDYSIGRLSGYWEMSFGRWNTDHPTREGSTWVTQFGLTPVLRFYPQAWGGRWFVEGGIGANLLLPVYRSRDKRFSTTFNFGDHLAVGRRFGRQAEHEIALRVQHFSNAGIKSPNPGEDFIQLRYSRRF